MEMYFSRLAYRYKKNSQSREEYITALKSADCGDYDLLLEYMRRFGGKDPALSEVLGYPFYKKNFKGKRLLSLVKAHIRQGYPVNETVNNGNHPLQLAITQGLKEVFSLLVDAGADIYFRDRSRYTPFETAIAHGHLPIAKILYDLGYPYTPRQPPCPKLIQHYANLHKFDQRYF